MQPGVVVIPCEPSIAGLHFDTIANLTNEEVAELESIEPECDNVMELFALFNTVHWLEIGLRADQICDYWEEQRGGEVAEGTKNEMMEMMEWERNRLILYAKPIRQRKAKRRRAKRKREQERQARRQRSDELDDNSDESSSNESSSAKQAVIRQRL